VKRRAGPFVWASGLLLALAGVVAVLALPNRGPSPGLAWDSLAPARDAGGADSLTIVTTWSLADDGAGPADSFAVSLWAQSGGSAPATLEHVVRGTRDSFTLASSPGPLTVDLRASVQAFRGVQVSRPASSVWHYPSKAGFSAPAIDSAAGMRLVLQLPPVSFGRSQAATRDTTRPTAPAPVPATPAPRPRPDEAQPPVTAPSNAVAGSACRNEPAGFRAIEGGEWSAIPARGGGRRIADRWRMESHPDRFSIVEDPGVPQSDKRVIEGRFPQGHPGGRGPFKIVRHFPEQVRSVYMCILHQVSGNFTNNGNTGTKFGFLLTPYQEGRNRVNHYFNLANRLGINLQSGGGTLNRNMPSQFNMMQHRGEWVRVEYLIIANAQGTSDGAARIWVNGRPVLSESNVRYFFPDQEPGFTGVTWNPTYGGGSNPVPQDMYQRIGEWYISGR
jgi:hypothetical protein